MAASGWGAAAACGWLCGVLAVGLSGCGPSSGPSSDAASGAASGASGGEGAVEADGGTAGVGAPGAAGAVPTLVVADGFSFDPGEPWTPLRAEELPAPLDGSTPVSRVELGERLVIFNASGRWRPATLAVVFVPAEDASGAAAAETVLAVRRLDLPPAGVVRAPSPFLWAGAGRLAGFEGRDGEFQLRVTEPMEPSGAGFGGDAEDSAGPPVLLAREIGTAAEEFTPELAAELGWGSVREIGAGDAVSAEAAAAAAALRLAGAAGVTVTGRSWSAGVSAASSTLRRDGFRRIVMHDRTTSFASFDRPDPDEAKHARAVAEAIEEAGRIRAQNEAAARGG